MIQENQSGKAGSGDHVDSVHFLADIADFHGQASFKVEGDNLLKRIEYFGMRLDFINDDIVRLRSRNLDVRLSSAKSDEYAHHENVTSFPLDTKSIEFAHGNEADLAALCHELASLAPQQAVA